jgi:hypothetical protein
MHSRRSIAITKENQQRNREVCEWIQSTHKVMTSPRSEWINAQDLGLQ